MKVLVAEAISDAGINLLKQAVDTDVRKLTPAELVAAIGEYDALITRSETKVTAEVLAAGKKLKVVGRAGVGVDNIDVEAATECGVVVVNVPGANTISTAEHAFGMLIASARHIPQACAALKAGKWDRKTYTGIELYNKTLGVIGLGRIGSEVAARAQAFGMKVLAFDPYVTLARAEQLGITLADLNTLLSESDFVTIHAAKTSDSAKLIRAQELALMKPTARIVNCSRFFIFDEEALYDALKAGRLSGAGLDVFATEPCTDSPLYTLPNVVVTPHLSASTLEAQELNGVMIAQQVLRVLQGDLVPEAVNLPMVPKDEAQTIVQHIKLAEVLGSFLVQAFGGGAERIQVTYDGDLAKLPTNLLTNTVLKGYLSGYLGETVNYINAQSIARRRGISISESKAMGNGGPAPGEGSGVKRVSLGGSPATTISVQVQGAKGEREVTGILTRGGDSRLLSINHLGVDLVPGRYLLVSRHSDRPGMLGRIGMTMAEANINIAGLHLGRQSARGEAVMVMLLDDPVSPDALQQVRELDGIIEAHAVVLSLVAPNRASA